MSSRSLEVPALELIDVTKRYPDGTLALDRVSLRVQRGEFVALLGASGAGKSTLLRVANGLVQPCEGTVHVDGTVLTPASLKRIRRSTAMVFQHFQLVPRLTVERNVLIGALARQRYWRALFSYFPMEERRRANRLLAEVGLREEQVYRRATELSGGEQQRVAIARAFLSDPRLLLADEPVASLDPALSAEILSLLRDQARKTATAVLCSLHQTSLAFRFANRIVCVRAGKIVADVAPSALTPEVLSNLYSGALLESA
jgi:phosphonate transport system ATP-binding protein